MSQKHPIDELFRTKLVDYEIPAREELKQVFLAKTQKKKKVMFPLWFLAVAASIIAVFSFFWLAQESSGIDSGQVLSANEFKPIPESTTQEVVVEKENSNKVIQNTHVQKIKSNVKKVLKIGNAESKVSMAKNAIGLEIMDELIQDELTLALIESQKNKNTTAKKESNNQNDLFKKDVGETIIIVASEYQQEEELFIPEMGSDSPVTLGAATAFAKAQNQQNNSLLAKVFTNIQHLKHGEKVDFSLTAQNELAEDTFIGNEASEIKEKINWIKSKIAKR